MPFNDSSVQCYNDFLSVIGVMQGLVDKYDSCSFIFGGDLNTSESSTTSTRDLLSNFCIKIACCGWILRLMALITHIITLTLVIFL